ncbi:MAG: methyltransferase domain-containing protein [Phenylobacterium sp.]
MEPKLQRRVQRYGWDRAVGDYEAGWRQQLAPAQGQLLALAAPAPGESVLDVACGTGLATFEAARAVGPGGRVLGIDISGEMISFAHRRAAELGLPNTSFQRMEAEQLDLADASFDVGLCALGLMYVPEPEAALAELRRVLRPGGRMALAVWGERARCGWAAMFPIVDAEVASDVCPLFFRLGAGDTLARLSAEAGFQSVQARRLSSLLGYADGAAACDAAFVGGPAALAWSHFDEAVRARVRARYLDSIEPWRKPWGYEVPGEFVVVSGVAP